MRRNARRFVEFVSGRNFTAGMLLRVQAGEGPGQAQEHFIDVAFAHRQRRCKTHHIGLRGIQKQALVQGRLHQVLGQVFL
ncbi:hypothetical protein D3C73_1559510 [compost metagenome]